MNDYERSLDIIDAFETALHAMPKDVKAVWHELTWSQVCRLKKMVVMLQQRLQNLDDDLYVEKLTNEMSIDDAIEFLGK